MLTIFNIKGTLKSIVIDYVLKQKIHNKVFIGETLLSVICLKITWKEVGRNICSYDIPL